MNQGGEPRYYDNIRVSIEGGNQTIRYGGMSGLKDAEEGAAAENNNSGKTACLIVHPETGEILNGNRDMAGAGTYAITRKVADLLGIEGKIKLSCRRNSDNTGWELVVDAVDGKNFVYQVQNLLNPSKN